jgi:hypothetical protein
MTSTQIDNKDPFVGQMSMLLRLIEAGVDLKIRDSPISSIAEIASELIYALATMLANNPKWGLLPNKGLKFVETVEVANDNNEGYFDALSRPRADGFQEIQNPFARQLGEAYYEYAGDPLGNPLQVEISFDDPSRSIKIADRLEMADLLTDFSHFLSDLQNGRIDWQFMRQVRKYNQSTQINRSTRHAKNGNISQKSLDIILGEKQRAKHKRLKKQIDKARDEFHWFVKVERSQKHHR